MSARFVYVFSKLFGYKSMTRNIPYLISTLMLPLAILFIFRMISYSKLFPFAILGGMVSLLLTNGLNTLFDSSRLRINQKFHDLLIATPLSPSSYLWGMIFNELFFASPSIAVYAVIGVIYHIYTVSSVIPIACILFMLYVAISALAFFMAGFPDHMRGVWGYTNILVILLSLLPPIYYPYTYLPKWLLGIFLILPTTSASILLQYAAGLAPLYTPALAIFPIEVAACVLLAVVFTRWRSK